MPPVYRSALATDPPPSLEELYVTEPVFQVEDEEPPYTKVVVVSAMQDAPCFAEGGDKLHYLSILNKQVQNPVSLPSEVKSTCAAKESSSGNLLQWLQGLSKW